MLQAPVDPQAGASILSSKHAANFRHSTHIHVLDRLCHALLQQVGVEGCPLQPHTYYVDARFS
jgi:hypothetical protein